MTLRNLTIASVAILAVTGAQGCSSGGGARDASGADAGPDAKPCASDPDCNDGDPCTVDSCSGPPQQRSCVSARINGCEPCPRSGVCADICIPCMTTPPPPYERCTRTCNVDAGLCQITGCTNCLMQCP